MAISSYSFDSLYLNTLTPEYCQGFDLLLAGWRSGDSPLLAFCNSPLHVIELLKRAEVPLRLASGGRFNLSTFLTSAPGWNWGEICILEEQDRASRYECILWIEPDAAGLETDTVLTTLAGPRAELRVLVSGGLHSFLPIWRQYSRPSRWPFPITQMMRRLELLGWRITRVTSLHGPRSIAWSALSRVAQRLGRPDWADRCLLAMRAVYREAGWLWPLSTLVFLEAQRG
jgi:hypothetical protein